ncbi:ABC transporter permease [Roseomonas sp. HF4]|uniref:ABC transporter permease n=1 Tax=Roseomonas sp. HF4 TaxID=2562313 RepID=UPI0010C0C4EC|nr:ABC transporter permease [Roseomonas sp. HF4]
MNLFGLALSNLRRRPARTLLSILGIGVAVGGAIALLSLGQGIKAGVGDSLGERGADLVVTQRAATDAFGGRLPEALGERLAAVPGVAEVNRELIAFVSDARARPLLAAGVPATAAAVRNAPIVAGRNLRAGDERHVVLGDVIAESLGLAPGMRVDLAEESFEVVGIARWASRMNRSVVLMPLETLQAITYRPGQVTGFHIRLAGPQSAGRRAEVGAALAAVGPVIVSEAAEAMDHDRNIAVLDAVSLAVSLMALALGGLNVLSTQLMSVQERTREIGMISAIGWSDGRLLGLILLEGTMLGVIGCMLGVGIGIAFTGLFEAIPAIGSYISFKPSVGGLLVPLAGALVLCAVGALYPAWRAVRLSPAAALRRG